MAWCMPPALPGGTAAQRRLDRFLRGPWSILYFAGVVVLLNAAPHMPLRWELAAEGLASLGGASWCGLNFWRCRQAHCAVTATGWLALALLAGAGAAAGHSLIGGDEQVVLLGVLAVGIGFEAVWWRARGTHALPRVFIHPPRQANAGSAPRRR